MELEGDTGGAYAHVELRNEVVNGYGKCELGATVSDYIMIGCFYLNTLSIYMYFEIPLVFSVLLLRNTDLQTLVGSFISKARGLDYGKVICTKPKEGEISVIPKINEFSLLSSWGAAKNVLSGKWNFVLNIMQDNTEEIMEMVLELERYTKFGMVGTVKTSTRKREEWKHVGDVLATFHDDDKSLHSRRMIGLGILIKLGEEPSLDDMIISAVVVLNEEKMTIEGRGVMGPRLAGYCSGVKI